MIFCKKNLKCWSWCFLKEKDFTNFSKWNKWIVSWNRYFLKCKTPSQEFVIQLLDLTFQAFNFLKRKSNLFILIFKAKAR